MFNCSLAAAEFEDRLDELLLLRGTDLLFGHGGQSETARVAAHVDGPHFPEFSG